MFVFEREKLLLGQDDKCVDGGEDKSEQQSTERRCGNAVAGPLGSVVGMVKGECRGRSGI